MQRRKIIHDDMKRDVSYWRYKKNVKSYIESNTSSVDLNNDLNSLKDIMEKVDSHSFFKKIVHQYFFSHKADHGIENGFIEVEIEAVIDAREKVITSFFYFSSFIISFSLFLPFSTVSLKIIYFYSHLSPKVGSFAL